MKKIVGVILLSFVLYNFIKADDTTTTATPTSVADEKEKDETIKKLIESINNNIKNSNFSEAILLLKQLASYKKREHYKFIYDTIKELFKQISSPTYRQQGGGLNLLILLRMIESTEFYDYHKWVFENPEFDVQTRYNAIHSLLHSVAGEDLLAYLFEQFSKESNIELKMKILTFIGSLPKYKSKILKIVTDNNEDIILRKKILLSYVNDNSDEVKNTFETLKNAETPEELKKIVTIITNVKSSNQEGVVILTNSEHFKEGDIITKVGDTDVTKTGRFTLPPSTPSPQSNREGEKISIILQRNGQTTTLELPIDKLREELKTIEAVFVKKAQ
jgi:hypothetical protein